MLGALTRTLSELTLHGSGTIRSVQQRSLSVLQSSRPCNALQRVQGTGLSSTPALLAPSTQDIHSKRCYFTPMDEHGRGETAAQGYGVTLYSPKDGQRTGLKAVELRFKRLDWGMWIRPRAGKDKKDWKQNTQRLRTREKHVFCANYHRRRFDRAVLSEVKEIRYIPDDPYKVYNDLSYQNYHSTKLKNMELIKKYGPTIYKFPWFRSHFKRIILTSDKNNTMFYEPPGYHKDIHDGHGIYSPDPLRPQNEPAPNYELNQRGVSKIHLLAERKYWRKIQRGEPFLGEISQSHVLKLPVYGSRIG